MDKLRRETTEGIIQELIYNEREYDYDLVTTLNPEIHGENKFRCFQSFAWVDVRRRESMFERELEKARQAIIDAKPSEMDLLIKRLGFQKD